MLLDALSSVLDTKLRDVCLLRCPSFDAAVLKELGMDAGDGSGTPQLVFHLAFGPHKFFVVHSALPSPIFQSEYSALRHIVLDESDPDLFSVALSNPPSKHSSIAFSTPGRESVTKKLRVFWQVRLLWQWLSGDVVMVVCA